MNLLLRCAVCAIALSLNCFGLYLRAEVSPSPLQDASTQDASTQDASTQDASTQDSPAQESPLQGYASYAEMDAKLQTLAASPKADLRSLGETLEQRQVWLLHVSSNPEETRPAIVVVGNVQASHVVGRELALRMAEHLINSAESPEVAQLLEQYSVYFIPCPSPDATEKNFSQPLREHHGNLVKTDDDRDFEVGEDPPVDLNGDGLITMLRIADPFGTHRAHPNDSRVLIPIDSKKAEVGSYRLEVESRDADEDKSFGEDAADGVEFNRNFTFNYPYFGKGAGPHQVSEVETRAVADFLFDHPNIAFVYCFSPEDNLFHPWKGTSQTDSGRIKTKILTSDQQFTDKLAEKFRKLHGGENAPESPAGAGSFSEWAYFHYGRWTFASRGWWVPQVAKPKVEKPEPKAEEDSEQKDAADDAQQDKPKPADDAAPSEKPSETTDRPAGLAKDDKRGALELNALKWFESQGIDAFVPWQPIEHPDLPGKQVEVGGFKPLYMLNPPVDLIDPLVQPHIDFLQTLVEHWPRVEVQEVEAKKLGPGLYDIRCQLVNVGSLPTMPQMAATSRQWYPIQIQLTGTGQARWIQGSQRQAVGRLAESGGKSEIRWVFQITEPMDVEPEFAISVSAPTLHPAEQPVEINE